MLHNGIQYHTVPVIITGVIVIWWRIKLMIGYHYKVGRILNTDKIFVYFSFSRGIRPFVRAATSEAGRILKLFESY